MRKVLKWVLLVTGIACLAVAGLVCNFMTSTTKETLCESESVDGAYRCKVTQEYVGFGPAKVFVKVYAGDEKVVAEKTINVDSLQLSDAAVEWSYDEEQHTQAVAVYGFRGGQPTQGDALLERSLK